MDDCTRFMWIYVLSTKYQVASVFLHFEAFIGRQFHTKIKMLQSEGVTELKSLETHLF